MANFDWKYFRYRLHDKMAEILHKRNKAPKKISSKANHAHYSKVEFFESFNKLRLLLNYHTFIGTSVMVFLTLSSLVFVICQLLPPKKVPLKPDTQWYYDQNTRKLFVDKSELVTPFDTGSGIATDKGPAGVRAHVYSYSNDNSKDSRFIVFVEKLAPNAQDYKDQTGYRAWANSRLIRRVDERKWVKANSPHGKMIISQLSIPDAKGNPPQNVPAVESYD